MGPILRHVFSLPMGPIPDALQARMTAAWENGGVLNLSGHQYGPGYNDTPGYYRLLAGLVRTEGMTQIVEIGTHHGGSTLAMHAAAQEATIPAHITTVDVVALEGARRLRECAGVRALTGDALAESTLRAVCAPLSPPIDLLFIDAEHRYGPTLEALAMYAERLRPKLVALDDIHLNGDMRAVWRKVVAEQPGRTADVSQMCDRVTGFGVLAPSTPLPAWEHGPFWRSRMRRVWRLERALSGKVPWALHAPVHHAQQAVWRMTRR